MEDRQKGVPRPAGKISWHGVILSVQPRIRLLRSFDQRSHSYQGYVLQIRGVLADETRDFTVGVGESAHAKHQFQVGDEVSGEGVFVTDTRMETAEIYKVSKLRVQKHEGEKSHEPPPWHSLAPELRMYRPGLIGKLGRGGKIQ